MGVPRTLTQIAFAAPLDESTEPEILDPTAGFPVLGNVRQNRRGGLTKRTGYAADSLLRQDGSSRSAGRRLVPHKNAYGVIDGTTLDVFTYGQGAPISLDMAVSFGRVPEATYSILDTSSPTASAYVFDVEYCHGLIAVAYADKFNGKCFVGIYDADTGVQVLAPMRIADPAMGTIALAHFDTHFVAVQWDSFSQVIVGYAIDVGSLVSGWSLLFTTPATSPAIPAVCSLTDRIAIIYGLTSGTHRVVVETYALVGMVASVAFVTGATTPTALDISGRLDDLLWPIWVLSGTGIVRGGAISPLTMASAAPDINIATGFTGPFFTKICASTENAKARYWALDGAVATTQTVRYANLEVIAGVITVTHPGAIYNVLPVSRPFCRNGRYYMACAPEPFVGDLQGNGQSLCVIADWTDTTSANPVMRPVVNIEPGLCPGVSVFGKVARIGTGDTYALGFQRLKTGLGDAFQLTEGNGTTDSAVAILDFNDRQRWHTTPHNGVTIIGGGVTSVLDGSSLTELGFISRPQQPTTAISAGPGTTGTFKYVAIYEDVDASGNWVVSGISAPSFAVTAANETVTVSVPPLTVTSRIGALTRAPTTRVAFYRTVTGGSPPYYRVGATVIDPSANSVDFADKVTDTVLATRAKLYSPNLPGSVGGSLDRRAPPQLRFLVSYAGMLVGAKGGSLFFSGQPVYGEATWFSPVFEVPISGTNSITALAVLDETLYIFDDRGIWIASGEIPSDNGASGGIGTPRRLASDVGCVDANSVVVTAVGIFFRSYRGIELLSGGGRPTWIGEKVQNTLAAFPNVTSAAIDERNNIVRFSLTNGFDAEGNVTQWNSEGGEDLGGRDLVFDLVMNDWQSVDDKTGSAAPHTASQHAAVINFTGYSVYGYLESTGVVWFDNDGSYRDGTAWVTQSAETAWFKSSGVQGRQQFELALALFRKRSPLQISIALGFDYRETYETAATWSNVQLDSLLSGGWPITQLRHDGSDNAEGQAIRVRITDAPPADDAGSDSGQGATWLALTLNITPKDGPAEVPEEAA